ncbi:hypothetical protein M413DRAFT_27029 [Hebeloma cylindrosporum]|uniref:Uncharacterized protein n=1 Tax=Hebeloma cylindrosporum TaxID=76867 RepID=A0A0C3CDD3_HEBCY|nr:hypothetical protein M413DRAFT_27029 [Hebeloma cylindrosporum h7]
MSFDGEQCRSSSIPSCEPNDVASNPPPRRSFAIHPSPDTSFDDEQRVEPSCEPNDVAGNPTATSNPFPRTPTSFDSEQIFAIRTSSHEPSDVVGGFTPPNVVEPSLASIAIANGTPSNETEIVSFECHFLFTKRRGIHPPEAIENQTKQREITHCLVWFQFLSVPSFGPTTPPYFIEVPDGIHMEWADSTKGLLLEDPETSHSPDHKGLLMTSSSLQSMPCQIWWLGVQAAMSLSLHHHHHPHHVPHVTMATTTVPLMMMTMMVMPIGKAPNTRKMLSTAHDENERRNTDDNDSGVSSHRGCGASNDVNSPAEPTTLSLWNHHPFSNVARLPQACGDKTHDTYSEQPTTTTTMSRQAVLFDNHTSMSPRMTSTLKPTPTMATDDKHETTVGAMITLMGRAMTRWMMPPNLQSPSMSTNVVQSQHQDDLKEDDNDEFPQHVSALSHSSNVSKSAQCTSKCDAVLNAEHPTMQAACSKVKKPKSQMCATVNKADSKEDKTAAEDSWPKPLQLRAGVLMQQTSLICADTLKTFCFFSLSEALSLEHFLVFFGDAGMSERLLSSATSVTLNSYSTTLPPQFLSPSLILTPPMTRLPLAVLTPLLAEPSCCHERRSDPHKGGLWGIPSSGSAGFLSALSIATNLIDRFRFHNLASKDKDKPLLSKSLIPRPRSKSPEKKTPVSSRGPSPKPNIPAPGPARSGYNPFPQKKNIASNMTTPIHATEVIDVDPSSPHENPNEQLEEPTPLLMRPEMERGYTLLSMAQLWLEYGKSTERSTSTTMHAMGLATKRSLKADEVVDLGPSYEMTGRFHLHDKLARSVIQTVEELQVFIRRMAALMPEHKSYFILDPDETLLEILEGGESLGQLLAAWRVL